MANHNALMKRNAELRSNFKVGDEVKWDGSGDARYPRIYKGVIIEMEADTAIVEDNGWHARSSVPFYKLSHEEA